MWKMWFAEGISAGVSGTAQIYVSGSVYQSCCKSEEVKAERLIGMLYEEFMEHEDWLPAEYQRFIEQGEPKETVICDYIAGMTDNYAIDMAKKIFIPKSWSKE